MLSNATSRSLGLFLGGLIAAAVALPGCGGGGGSASTITSAGVLAPGATFSKQVRLQFAGITADQCRSIIASLVTTIPEESQTRSIRLRVFQGSTEESSILQERTVQVPPFSGTIIVSDISAGDHYMTVEAFNSSNAVIFSAEQVVRFAPGEPAFVDFIASPTSTLRSTYAGGAVCPEVPFTFVLANKGSPYRMTDVMTIPAGTRFIIEPGVQLQFTAQSDATRDNEGKPHTADIRVLGRLLAVGTQDQPIVFSHELTTPTTLRPRIFFVDDQPDPIQSRVRFAIIERAGTGVELQNSDVSISGNVFRTVLNGVILGRNATSRVVGNQFNVLSTAVLAASGSTTDISRNTVTGGRFGIALSDAGACLVENNVLATNSANTSGSPMVGLFVERSSQAILNNNTVRHGAGQMAAGIQVRSSNALLSQNRVTGTPTRTTAMNFGVSIDATVSGTAASDRLVLDHNTVTGASLANVFVNASDPVLRFNELASGAGFGVAQSGIRSILPKQPLLIGNNVRGNALAAVAPIPGTTGAGGVLGSAIAGGENFVADNNGRTGADTTVQGAQDNNFDVTTPQIVQVDAILSASANPISGAGAPVSTGTTTVP